MRAFEWNSPETEAPARFSKTALLRGGGISLRLRDALFEGYWSVAPYLDRKNYRSGQQQRSDCDMGNRRDYHREFRLDCIMAPGDTS